jgi:hypothetical protein
MVTIATDCGPLTRCMDVSCMLGYEGADVFISVYRVYSLSTNNTLMMWLCDVFYTTYIKEMVYFLIFVRVIRGRLR